MTDYIAEINKNVAIFGDKIEGERNHSGNPVSGSIAIKGFRCKIVICANKKCKKKANALFSPYFDKLSGEHKDSMSGKRAIIEPALGYDGPSLKTKKRPKKGSQHRPIFSLNQVNNYPAICYPDNFVNDKVKLNRVKRKKIILEKK